MNELKAIVRAYDEAVLQGQQMALATVVAVEGSSYRRPGARMLVTEAGQLTGAISGGCLEGDALRKAQLAIVQGRNKLVIYDTTTDEDDLQFGVQLGCNGIVSILFEPIVPDAPQNPIELLRKAVATRRPGLLVTAFAPDNTQQHLGTCGFISEAETLWYTSDNPLRTEAVNGFAAESSQVQTYESYQALYQWVPPPVHLLLVGAGNDAQPVATMASLLGWELTVIDGRATHATPARFPQADRIRVVKAEDALESVLTDEQTAAVLMTHNYNYDLALLRPLLESPCSYIGILGPKTKTEQMIDALSESGAPITERQRSRIYGPVGLDIGAEGAAEIAVSIVSGIQAAFARRDGQPLKFRNAPIHTEA
ncbi:MAG: XdhC/CoxI family protein [Sphingobacteriales bacterium]|nr:MAG: XdhC/CoxI family protein [Sphingobacteriales bacterium]